MLEVKETKNLKDISKEQEIHQKHQSRATFTQRQYLKKPFFLDEITKTVFSCNPSKALALMGFTFLFLSKFVPCS